MNRNAVRFAGLVLVTGSVAAAGWFIPPPGHSPLLTEEISPGGIAYRRINIPGADGVRIEVIWPSDQGIRPEANQDVATIGCNLILSGGAAAYAPGDSAEAFADLHAHPMFWTLEGKAGMHLDVPRHDLSAALTLTNAHLRAPAMAENWFTRERHDLAGKAREDDALPERQLHDALRYAFLGDGPLRRAKSGERPEAVMAISRGDVVAWHKATFTRQPKTIILAGDITAREAGTGVDELLAGLPDAAAPTRHVVVRADFHPRRILLHVPSAKTSTLLIAGALPPISAGLKREDDFLLDALAGPGGVLLERVRTDLHAAYAFGWSGEYAGDDARYFLLEGQVETAMIARADAGVRQAYAKFRETAEPMDLDDMRARAAARLRGARDDPAEAAGELLFDLETRQDPTVLENPDTLLDTITDESVAQRLRHAFPKASDLTVMVVSPDAKALPDACVITAPDQAATCK